MPPINFDITYFLLLAVATGIGLLAQSGVKNTFRKYSTISTKSGLTGQQISNNLLNNNGEHTEIVPVKGELSDHFDPSKNVVRLSEPVFGASSISAVAVAAHESGHVLQYRGKYAPMTIRSALVPVVNLGSTAAWPLFLIGLMTSITGLIYLGIVLYAGSLLFQLITLPVELNASSRALKALEEGNYLTADELPGAKAVLRAAAMTYVAAALASAIQLLQYILIANTRRRRR